MSVGREANAMQSLVRCMDFGSGGPSASGYQVNAGWGRRVLGSDCPKFLMALRECCSFGGRLISTGFAVLQERFDPRPLLSARVVEVDLRFAGLQQHDVVVARRIAGEDRLDGLVQVFVPVGSGAVDVPDVVVPGEVPARECLSRAWRPTSGSAASAAIDATRRASASRRGQSAGSFSVASRQFASVTPK